MAKTNDMNTFCDYETAVNKADAYDGIGFCVGNGISAMDLDNCINDDGTLLPFAQDIVDIMKGSYIEKSPSSKGLRIIIRTDDFKYDKIKYLINNQKLGLEVYVSGATNRFVTVTGNAYRDGVISNMTDKLQIVLDKYMLRPNITKPAATQSSQSFLTDETLFKKACTASNGKAFIALWKGDTSKYGSHSEADLALCNMLAFWCGRDIEQMDRMFRRSGLMRDKWDRKQSGTTYGGITLSKAAGNAYETYKPGNNKKTNKNIINSKTGIKTLDSITPNNNKRYAWSDIGNGNLFGDWYKDIARYVPERKKWFVFDGKAWRSDTGNIKVMSLCKCLANELMIYALSIKDEKARNTYIEFVRRWQSRRSRETILKDAQDVHAVSMTIFDNKPYLLNCINGTLNLHEGKFYKHSPNDMLTKVANVKYNPQASCDRWIKFVDEVMSDDMEKAVFLQKALGYALTGDTRYEALFILYGATTRNGKGTCMETFLKITGDYGKVARPETIGMKLNNSSTGPTEDIARLAGARFVNISEPDKKLKLSAALVKTLTGNDTVNARFLHENSFDFRPQFKIFINTNYLPQVTDITLFNSGRVNIIPFNRHFKSQEQDKGLKNEFAKSENLSGILNWCIEGYKKLQMDGFEIPRSVIIATQSYQHDSDKIGLFIEECLIKDNTREVRSSYVYKAYSNWCEDNGFGTENMRNFKASLESIVEFKRKRPNVGGEKTTMIIGYTLT